MASEREDTERRARRRAAKVRNRVLTTAATYCVLSLAGAVSFVLPEAVPVASVAEHPKPVYGSPPDTGTPDEIARAIAGRAADEAGPADAQSEPHRHPGGPAAVCNLR